MKYDSKGDTLEHIRTVQTFIDAIIRQLMDRAKYHDASKLETPEKEYFDVWTPKLSGVTYGSDEYRDMLDKMRPAIDHHQKTNRHHPEYFEYYECNGCFTKFHSAVNVCNVCGYSQFTTRGSVEDMNLIDLIEMLCDWKAATMRHKDGDIRKSLEINQKRFDIPPFLVGILEKTLSRMGW